MGAAFNALMEEETKESLAKLCCDLMGQLSAAKPKQYEFLDDDFLTLMNDIGRLGHEKFGADAFEVTGGKRKIERHQTGQILRHAHQHALDYENGILHDHFGTRKHQLAAAAFNLLMEFYFSQGE